MIRRLAGVALLATIGCAGGRGARPAMLYRCRDDLPALCLSARATFTPENAVKLIGVDPATRATGWLATFRGDTLGGVGVPTGSTPVAGRVLLLLDVSGSMKGPKIGAARLVLRQFLGSLDSVSQGSVRVAVAPFGSVDVTSRIDQARFETPDSAVAAINRLPNPERENTALFSAVSLGLHRLNDEVRRTGPATVGLLVVITDGNNEVRPGDDAGLLAGPVGLAEASRTVAESPAAVGILGIGSLDRATLNRLAGPRGRVFPIPGNPSVFDLARPLGMIAGVLQTSWLVTFALPAGSGRSDLARRWDRLELGLALERELVPAGVAVWKAPLVALPAVAGTVSAAVSPPVIGGASAGGWLGGALLVVVLLIVMLEVWVVVPKLIWTTGARTFATLAPSGGTPAAKRTAPAPTGQAPIRTDLTEIPPRKPSDVTASRARPA